MRIAFVDESETRDNVYVFAAIIADSSQIVGISRALDAIAEDLCAHHGVPPGTELHAQEIFQGRGVWAGVPPRMRTRVQEQIIDALSEHGVTLTYRAVDGPGLRARQQWRRYPVNFSVEQEAFKHLLQRVQAYSVDKQVCTLVIADERSDRESHREALAMHRFQGTPGEYWRTSFENILDTVHFAPSNHSRMLQAADHLAFFARRRIEVPEEPDPRAERVMKRIMVTVAGPNTFECGIWWP